MQGLAGAADGRLARIRRRLQEGAYGGQTIGRRAEGDERVLQDRGTASIRFVTDLQ